MKSDNEINNDMKSEAQVVVGTSGNRRKLIRGGMVGVPVLLALKSTPVLACSCKLPSGFSTSGNLSRNGGKTCEDPARTPFSWKTNVSGNKYVGTGSPGVSKNTVFNTVFAGGNTATFDAILQPVMGSTTTTFASLVIAAYLGIKSNSFVSNVTIVNIQDMWGGAYKPPGSINAWSLAQSENYLRYTMGLPLNPA